jgi:threonine dehydrogenase-like Zn-dependent dehydrogenase
MRGTVLYGPRDVRFEERPDPSIIRPTDAIVRLSVTSICGYRAMDERRAIKTLLRV